MLNKWNFRSKDLKYLYNIQNLSAREISINYKCPKTTVIYYLKKFDIERKSNVGHPGVFKGQTNLTSSFLKDRSPKFIEKKVLVQLYLKEGLTMQQIADQLKTCRANVFKYLKKYQIQTRKRGQHKVWNTGLTKFTDIRLEIRGRKHSIYLKNLIKNNVSLRKKYINGLIKGNRVRLKQIGINKIEKRLLDLLNNLFPTEYKYVGDGSLIIERYNPDFININGQKKIIELFGDYWHRLPGYVRRDRRKKRIYSNFGYESLVIWEKELQNVPKLVKKLIEFNRNDSKFSNS